MVKQIRENNIINVKNVVMFFDENPRHQPISNETRTLIDKLLLEKISLEEIVRVTGVSKRWLQYYVNQKYYQVEKKATISKKKRGKLILQLDELWSFVYNKNLSAIRLGRSRKSIG